MDKSTDKFSEDVAVVTGAGVGIGYEIARQLSLAGAQVILNDIDASLANNAAKQIEQEGGSCLACPGDAGDSEFIDHMIGKAVDGYGKLTIAIANAGITTYGKFLSYKPDSFDRLLQVNLHGPFFLAQKAANQMIKQGEGGSLLFMSSVTGVQAYEHLVAYGMTKAALRMMARGLVSEIARHGITANAIAPGAVATERTLSEDPEYAKHWSRYTPTGRVSTPADVAQLALFLVSKDARQVNGQTIIVDGGWSTMSPTPELEFPDDSED